MYTRNNLHWNINELLSLQREYELLEMNVADIAKLHCRSVNAIVFRLILEGFASCWEDVRGYKDAELIQEAVKNGVFTSLKP